MRSWNTVHISLDFKWLWLRAALCVCVYACVRLWLKFWILAFHTVKCSWRLSSVPPEEGQQSVFPCLSSLRWQLGFHSFFCRFELSHALCTVLAARYGINDFLDDSHGKWTSELGSCLKSICICAIAAAFWFTSFEAEDPFPVWALATSTQGAAVKVFTSVYKCLLKAYLKANVGENIKCSPPCWNSTLLIRFSDSLKETISSFRIQTCAADLEKQVLTCLAKTNLFTTAIAFCSINSFFEVELPCLQF